MPNEYKIQSPEGLFSTGGCRPKWTKGGKTWTSLAHLKNHLNIMEEGVYKGCRLVTLEVVTLEVPGPDLKEMISSIKEAQDAQQTARDARATARDAAYAVLCVEFGRDLR